jgi:hypothetical protein
MPATAASHATLRDVSAETPFSRYRASDAASIARIRRAPTSGVSFPFTTYMPSALTVSRTCRVTATRRGELRLILPTKGNATFFLSGSKVPGPAVPGYPDRARLPHE